ncbi:MAG: IPTL-CTERM sorting domain-containing protein, partial [Thermodesulfobacteriota bacterium]
DVDDQLYFIDLPTGTAIPIGPTGFADIECLAFDARSVLYGVDDITNQLVICDTSTGDCDAVGPLGVDFTDCGLTFDCNGELFMSTDAPEPFTLYSIDPNTGQATAVGDQGQQVTGLAAGAATAICGSGVFGLGGDGTNNLGCMDLITGAFEEIGPLNTVNVQDGGIDFDLRGFLWGIQDQGLIFIIHPSTGAASGVTATLNGFEGLAIDAPTCAPRIIPTMSEWGLILMAAVLGIVGFIVYRRKMAAA